MPTLKTEAALARKAAGLTQKQAAKLLRRSLSTIRAAETPGGVCTPDTARKLAKHYNCSESAFLTIASEKQPGAVEVSSQPAPIPKERCRNRAK
jgi:transcriptional regulator with XRE-family HTH domain